MHFIKFNMTLFKNVFSRSSRTTRDFLEEFRRVREQLNLFQVHRRPVQEAPPLVPGRIQYVRLPLTSKDSVGLIRFHMFRQR